MIAPPRLRRTTLTCAMAALLAVTVAACGDDDDNDDGEASDGAAPTLADLEGRTFASTSVEGQELVEGTEIVLTFVDGAISAQAGCNTMTAGVEIDGSTLVVVNQMATTMMACEEPLEAQDEWLAAMLTADPEIALDGATLTLTGDDVTITAAEQA